MAASTLFVHAAPPKEGFVSAFRIGFTILEDLTHS